MKRNLTRPYMNFNPKMGQDLRIYKKNNKNKYLVNINGNL